MSCCAHCTGAGEFFGEKQARKDLGRLRRRGPNRTTSRLLAAILSRDVTGSSVLDIGGGVGAIPLALLEGGATDAIGVDASEAYLSAAGEELERRGMSERADLRFGDFVALAEGIPPADIVTLDRSICCYPHMERLVNESAGRARRLYGVVYPRDRWWVRGGLKLGNLWLALRRNPFRAFVHPTRAVDSLIREHGFAQVYRSTTFLWQVVLYSRS